MNSEHKVRALEIGFTGVKVFRYLSSRKHHCRVGISAIVNYGKKRYDGHLTVFATKYGSALGKLIRNSFMLSLDTQP